MGDFENLKHTLKEKLEYVSLSLLYVMFYAAVLNAVIAVFFYAIGWEVNYENLYVIFENITLINNESKPFWILGFLVLPLMEELTFRLPLDKKHRTNSITIVTGILLLIYSFYLQNITFTLILLVYLLFFLISNNNWIKSKKVVFDYSFWLAVIFSGLSRTRLVLFFENENLPLYLMFFTLMFVKSFFLAKIARQISVYYSFGLNMTFVIIPLINYFFNYK